MLDDIEGRASIKGVRILRKELALGPLIDLKLGIDASSCARMEHAVQHFGLRRSIKHSIR